MKSAVRLTYTLNNQDVEILFDASIAERHQGSAQITEHQVETGPNITDHIRPLPLRISLEAFVTNTPIDPVVLNPSSVPNGQTKALQKTGASTLQFDSRFFRVEGVYEALLTAQRGGALVRVETSLRSYDDFAIVSISAPRDVDHGNAVQFSIDMQEIITVDVVEVAAIAPKSQKKKGGLKSTTDANPKQEQQLKSVASSFADFITK